MEQDIAMHLMLDIINLHGKYDQDERVTVMERTNFRYATAADFNRRLPQFATIDVSFISLTLILPALKTILVPDGDVIALGEATI